MKYTSIMICTAINIIICFGIPMGYLIYIIRKRSGVKAFFIGALVFFISQILLRLPLLKLYLPLAILIHGIIDATIGIAATAGLGTALIESILGVYALGLLIFIIKSKKMFKEMC